MSHFFSFIAGLWTFWPPSCKQTADFPNDLFILLVESSKVKVRPVGLPLANQARRRFIPHRWCSGRMLACHAGGPGSIPGRCIFTLLLNDSPLEKKSRWLSVCRFYIGSYVPNVWISQVRTHTIHTCCTNVLTTNVRAEIWVNARFRVEHRLTRPAPAHRLHLACNAKTATCFSSQGCI